SFTVVLTSQPTADVTIALSSDNPAEGTVMPASLTFTSLDWSTAQTVTVTGVDDILIDGSQSYNIITAATVSQDADYNGINPDDVAVTNVDNDSPGMLVGNISGDTTEAGSTATFTVRLATGPAADVTLSVLSDSLSEGTVSPASLTFTSANWSTAQTVTVTGVDDFIADGDQAYQIWIDPSGSVDASYKTLANIQVPVTNLDDDVAGFSISAGSGNTTDNGGTASFSVSLTSEPTSNVTVNVSSDNTAEGTIGITSLTFTPADWAGTHLVMVTGAGDNYADGDQSYNIVLAAATSLDPVYSGMNPPDKPMINEDTFVLKMPDTGQTSCFDQAGTLITCPAANQVLEQDGTYPKNPLSYTDNGDLTVTDNNTGLMWQKDIDATTRGWNTAATYCTNLATGGYNDWRLPDIRELVSLVNFQNMNPAISAADFPGTALSSYWSNTTHAGNPGSALTVSFAAGVKSFQTKPTPLNVRCVRGVQVLTPAFVDNGDGTITDNTTGLMWMKDDDATGPQTWETAVHTCGAALGYFDWRLPNIKELQTIIKESQIAAPVIDSAFFPTAAADYYWSSTNNMGLTTEAWAVWFQDGKALNKPKSALYRARCVRL
ncbi:MAG: DUF1566 domain-containing protein, partial [Deltaproteobacteria bacterium]|nr:DUF1566 domain-containing protein [Deltaproteobacteria bacterium]